MMAVGIYRERGWDVDRYMRFRSAIDGIIARGVKRGIIDPSNIPARDEEMDETRLVGVTLSAVFDVENHGQLNSADWVRLVFSEFDGQLTARETTIAVNRMRKIVELPPLDRGVVRISVYAMARRGELIMVGLDDTPGVTGRHERLYSRGDLRSIGTNV